MNRLPWLLLYVLAAAGCGSGQEPLAAGGVPSASPPEKVAPGGDRLAGPGWHGYAGWAFSTPMAQLQAGGARPLGGTLPAGADQCQFLQLPGGATAGLRLMIEGGQFLRYDVVDSSLTAPGGGEVGMTRAQLEALYPAMTATPHKYQPGAVDLRVLSPTGQTALVFALGPEGRVQRWRLGQPPQVDYVEGCG